MHTLLLKLSSNSYDQNRINIHFIILHNISVFQLFQFEKETLQFFSFEDFKTQRIQNLMLFLFLLRLSFCQCQDYSLPKSSKSIIDALRSLKSSKSMKIFNKNTLVELPFATNFSQFQTKVAPFLIGQYYSCMPIIIIGLLAFLFFLSCTILIGTYCLPFERSKPGFLTTIIWWIFFTLVFIVSIAYFIMSLISSPDFVNGFPKIPETIKNGIMQIKRSIDLYVSSYEDTLYSSLNTNSRAYGAAGILYNLRGELTISQYQKQMSSLHADIDQIRNFAFGSCPARISINETNFASVQSFSSNFSDAFSSLIQSSNQFLQNSNIKSINDQISTSMIPIFDPFSNFLPKVQNQLTKYDEIELEKVKSSFNIDGAIKACFSVLNVILILIVLIFYIFQTVTFSMQNSFSRCCVIAIFPISMILAILFGCLGILSTSVSGAIGDLCESSTRFATQWYFSKPGFTGTFGTLNLSESLFSSSNNSLYSSIGAQYDIPIKLIENSTLELLSNSSNLVFNSSISFEIPNLLMDSNFSGYLEELETLYSIVSKTYAEIVLNECNESISKSFENFLYDIFYVQNQLNYGIKLQADSFSSFLAASQGQAKAALVASLPTVLNKLEELSLGDSINTSCFCCPLRGTKKLFCEQTGSTFSNFAIFTHFYIISLVGFGGLLCCRRQGMLSSGFHNDLDQNPVGTPKRKGNRKGKNNLNAGDDEDEADSFEPTTNDVIRAMPTQLMSKRGREHGSDTSDSSRTSDFSTFDMYQQSKTGVFI
ncbi:hypothetical protein TRFO_23651 [Tritrichomonas foetus]|uniref:Uncharacterized protein n=1 Tax=Tritrichomonas foetus TaxID=1144522 RepID=A0A1J4K953_9EUKA|nr:hypothetical protein TRFO_23651 [Tritrichomonas foetus]|eukprot:OHT08025.1 hypothetical protein TRFO_23651 [Tritrichomonas foetus]